MLQIVTVVANDVAIISNESLIVSNGDKSSRIGGGTFALIIVFVFVSFVFTVPVGVCNRTFCFNDCSGVVFGRRMRGEGGREHKKHVTSRLFPLVYITEAQPLEKYDAEDAISRERDVDVIFMQIFVLVGFPKKRDTLFRCAEDSRREMMIETKKTLEVGAAEETARAAERKKKKAFRLENDHPGTKKRARKAKKKKKKTKMVAKSPPEREKDVPLKEFSDVICLSDEEDSTDEEIIFVGSKEGKRRNQQQRRNEEEDDEVIICGERGGGKGKRQKQERREEGRNRGRKSVNEEEVIVVGEKESTQIRQARELLERHNRSNTNKKRKSSEGGSDANASPTGTRLSARKKKKATSSSPTKGPRNEPSTTPEPKGPQPKKTPKCVICLDEIEKPTATKCGHVYCDQCIRELIRAQKTKSRCPQCRKKVGLSGLTKLILDD